MLTLKQWVFNFLCSKLQQYQNIESRMVIEEDFDKAFFQSTFSNFTRQILAKQIQVSKIEMDLLRRFEGKTECIPSHLQIIRYCRKSVDKVDNMLRDVKQYFSDLKINGLYDLFQTMFRILVYDIKKISECYLRRFQTYKNNLSLEPKKQKLAKNYEEEAEGNQNLVCVCRQKRKEDIKKLQHLDFQIAGIEAKEIAIQDQMNFLFHNIRQEKQKIEKINPSSHRVILEQIQKFCEISKRAQTMFSNFFKSMFDDDNKNNYLEPQKFNEVFLKLKSQIKSITKNKIEKMQQILNEIYKQRKDTHVEQIRKQVRKESLKEFQNLQKYSEKNMRVKSRQHRKNSSDYSNNQFPQNTSNKRKISRFEQNLQSQELKIQIENLKKCNKLMSCQLLELKEAIKKEQQEKAIIDNLNKQLETLFKKRSHELESQKAQLKWVVEKNTKQTIILASQKMEIQEKFHKSLRNTYRANSNYKKSQTLIDKQSQTEAVSTPFVEQTDTFIIQHKPFMPLRTKMKKRTSTEAKQKSKLQQAQKIEKQLKETIGKIGQFLFEIDQDKSQEKNELEVLLKEQKYDLLILKLKQKLDCLYIQASQARQRKQRKQSKQIREDELKYSSDKKTKNNKKVSSLKPSVIKTKSQSNQNLYNQIGIQTNEVQKSQKQQKMVDGFMNRSSSRGNQTLKSQKQKYRKDRSKMVTMMNLESKFKFSSRDGTGLVSERTNTGYATRNRESWNVQSKSKQYQESGLISRFYRNSEIQSNTYEPTNSNSRAKKKSYLQNALFQQLKFDNNSKENQTKRHQFYKKMTNSKFKQSPKLVQSGENFASKKEKDVIKQEEQPNHSSLMSVVDQNDKENNTGKMKEILDNNFIEGLKQISSKTRNNKKNEGNLFKGW